ncbi:Copper homeostasis protein CutC (modular protein) [Aeromonas salmonicida]|nr:Copper homeostasis protein CutC (modular protein) [Aeromonas salmonicida]
MASTWVLLMTAGSISPTAPRWRLCGLCWTRPDTGRAAAWCLSIRGVNMGTSDDGRVNITDGAKVAAVLALLDKA